MDGKQLGSNNLVDTISRPSSVFFVFFFPLALPIYSVSVFYNPIIEADGIAEVTFPFGQLSNFSSLSFCLPRNHNFNFNLDFSSHIEV